MLMTIFCHKYAIVCYDLGEFFHKTMLDGVEYLASILKTDKG